MHDTVDAAARRPFQAAFQALQHALEVVGGAGRVAL
jgi:hypothetical protein